MFCIKFGRDFEVSSQCGDFLIRIGRREWYYEREAGWKVERVS
jgi:hypothetical protein